jgi:arylsulfatase A-like enzyme
MSKAKRPNIILITTDQQRYDTLGVNGSAIRTPHIDGLAREGVRFMRPYINNTVCIPSRACIQTGRYTHQHGLRYMESEIETTPGLAPWEETFMERLQVAGYETGAVGKIHMKPPKGFDYTALTNGQGARWTVPYGSPFGPAQLGDEYSRWLEERHPGGYALIYEQRRQPEYKKYKTSVVNVLPTEEYVDYWVTENAINYVSRERGEDQPFFLWYGLCNPHGPNDPPKEYAEMYREEDMQLSELYLKRPNPGNGPTEELLRRWMAFYYGLCTFVDDMAGKLFETLRAKGLWDDTLIIFTSDHGEMLGDFGQFGKGAFYESCIHVPLIIKPPRGIDEKLRPVVDEQVELIDLAPTILDYAGLRIPPTVQGESLRSVMQGKAGGKDAVLCEYTSNNQSLHEKCIRTPRYKYWYTATQGTRGGVTLFDLQEDPNELRNVADDPAYRHVRIDMQDRLMSHLLLSKKPILRWK